jgi:hypothetical protein
VLVGGAVATAIVGFVVLLVVAGAHGLGSGRDLADFASAADARSFVSEHLPAPLPGDAVVESLHYERWTDWFLETNVRLASAEATDRYLEQVRRDRKLNDAYCGGEEPADGVRYFLPAVMACGAVRRTSPQIIEVRCNTR